MQRTNKLRLGELTIPGCESVECRFLLKTGQQQYAVTSLSHVGLQTQSGGPEKFLTNMINETNINPSWAHDMAYCCGISRM